MKKRYLSLLLAAILLLTQSPGGGQMVYATEMQSKAAQTVYAPEAQSEAGQTVYAPEAQSDTGQTGEEYQPEFWLEQEINLLPDWEHEINRFDQGKWWADQSEDLPMEITDVSFVEEGTAVTEDGVEKKVSKDGSVTLEETENGWLLRANRVYGSAELSVTGMAAGENPASPDEAVRKETTKVTVNVTDKTYHLDVGSETGINQLHPGESIDLRAEFYLECWNEEEQCHYQEEVQNAEIIWRAESDREGVDQSEKTGNSYHLEAPDSEEDYEIHVNVTAKADGKAAASLGYDLYASGEFYVLEPGNPEEASELWAGQTTEAEPRVYLHKKGEGEKEVNGVSYRFDYNQESFEIQKESGTVENGMPYTGGTFTIKKQNNSDDRVRIEAFLDGEEEPCCDREWWFQRQDYDGELSLEGGREEYYSWIYVDQDESENDEEEARTFALNMGKIQGSYDIIWEIGFGGSDEEGNFEKTASENAYTTSEDKKQITINGIKLKEEIRAGLNMAEDDGSDVGFNLRAIVCAGEGEEQARRDMWIEIRRPRYELDYADEGDILLGNQLTYEGGKIGCQVENKEHPYGEYLKLPITSIEILNEDPENGTGPVWTKRQEGTNIVLAAENYGRADIKYHLTLPSGREKVLVDEKYVTNSIYRLNVQSSTGTYQLLPEAQLELQTEVWHGYYDEDAKSIEWEQLTEGYQIDYRDVDEAMLSVEDGTVKAKGQLGDAGFNIVASIPQTEGEPYERWDWIPVFIAERYYQVSAQDMTAAPGEKIDAVHWQWNRFDLEHRDGILEPGTGAYQIEETEWLQINPAGTGFTIDSNAPDGEKIEVWLTAERQEAQGEQISETGSFILTICNHNFVQKSLTAATCTETGIRVLECDKCHTATKTETLPAAGHKPGSFTTVKAATCTAAGSQQQKCAVCGKVMNTKDFPKTGHSFGDWKETAKPTALKQGTETRTCKNCNAAETRKTEKLKATIKLNVKKIPLQVKKSTAAVKVVSMTEGDGIASWKSSNKKVATVTSKGKITGKKAGTAKITVTLKSGISASVTVKVQKKAVTTTKLSVTGKSLKKNKLTLKKGKSVTLTAVRTPITSTEKITYQSSNKKIAAVTSKGKVTGKKPGKAKITVKSGKKKVTISVTVKKK